MKKILLLVGDYVEDLEAMVPFQSLLAYGFAVDCVCPGKKEGDSCRTAVHDSEGDQTYSEKRGHNFTLNATFAEVKAEVYDALIIAGGRSPEYLSLDPAVLSLVRDFDSARKPIASICHGQLILAAAGVLKGRKATAYPALKPVLVAAGAEWTDPDPGLTSCIIDDKHNLVTGAAWSGHPEFLGLTLLALRAQVSGNDKRVLVLCGDYMEDYEVVVPVQALQGLGYRVDTVCPGKASGDKCPTAIHDFEGAQTYSEKPGHNFVLNFDFDAVDVGVYDALVIPGGRAPEYLALNQRVLEIAKQFEEQGKVIASICHGQQILAAAGLLKGKKCTAYPALKPLVAIAGGEWVEPQPISKCFTHGKLITGAAWPGHPEFVAQIMAALGTTVAV